jgi:hypothetical protein
MDGPKLPAPKDGWKNTTLWHILIPVISKSKPQMDRHRDDYLLRIKDLYIIIVIRQVLRKGDFL